MIISTPIRLSIAAPAYNEGSTLHALVTSWMEYLQQQSAIAEFEIVICNDGSTDNKEVRPINFRINQGAAAALTAAIAATRYDWVLLIDADDQFPIQNFSVLLTTLKQTSCKAVLGIRNKQDSFIARYGSKLSGMICNVIHRSTLRDFNSACKLVEGKLLRSLKLETRGMNYSTEITSRLLECKVTIEEVDIIHQHRKAGKSNVKILKDSFARMLFVGYILIRQILLKFGILNRPLI
jgi:dolichol-phosphate mannosyltransferase